MKGIFIIFHELYPSNGVSKKILSQCKAINSCGNDIRLCRVVIDENGTQKRAVGEETISTFGTGIRATIRRSISFSDIVKYAIDNNIEFAYLRHNFNANPATVNLACKLHKAGIRLVIEIPTYPYDSEFKNARKRDKISHFFDKIYRHSFFSYFDYIVTYTNEETIFGRPTIRISNGIDFDSIKLKKTVNDTSKEFNLIGIAQINFWHGFDRVITGLQEYYNSNPSKSVIFHIVGEGNPSALAELKKLASKESLSEKVIFHGNLSGEKLDIIFDKCDMGIASLARHRSGISAIKTLKNREYAARGIPFIYSETDEDFDGMPYIIKAAADDSPIDINRLISFYDSLKMTPDRIRDTIDPALSWKSQMHKITEIISSIKPDHYDCR